MDKPEDLKTPLKSVRAYCLWCCNDSYSEVQQCTATDCSLWPLRYGKGSRGKGGLMKPIRAKCLDCSTYSPAEVTACKFKDCSLWHYRAGNNPFRKREMSEEHKSKLRAALKHRVSR